MTRNPSGNSLAGDLARTRRDVPTSVGDLATPRLAHFYVGGARLPLGSFAATFAQTHANPVRHGFGLAFTADPQRISELAPRRSRPMTPRPMGPNSWPGSMRSPHDE